LCDKRGISHEVQEEYWQRFEHAFATEAQEFIDSILHNSAVPLPLSLGVKVMQIARALQSALWSGEVSRFDEQGKLVSTGESKANRMTNGYTNGVMNGHAK
jgi:myo-inositol 2-dehydrogenase/D-chiro-inositol 1-dehydrogenase